MKKKLAIVVAVLCMLTSVAVLAQTVGADAPVVAPVTVTPDNPLPTDPFDLVDSVMVLINTFQSAWFLGVAVVLFLLVNLIRGKLRIGAWTVKIPKFSDWLEGTGKKFKSYFIVGLTGLGMAFAALKTVDAWEAWVVVKAMLGGLLAGIQLALAAIGLNSVVKNQAEAKVSTEDPK